MAHSDYLNWSVFRHRDVMRVLDDPGTFSNAMSAHLSIPNGMDAPEHTGYRRVVDRYFTPGRMATFEPVCHQIAVDLVERLPDGGEIELMATFAREFSVWMQSAFLGWPKDLHEPLLQWIDKNHKATLARDKGAMAAVAVEFDVYIKELLDVRRKAGSAAPDDITTSLLRDKVAGRALRDEEIVSILRNWTVGELGTIAAGVGILAHYLAEHPDVQRQVRAQPSSLPAAIDEILRMHGPLISSRRTATRTVEIGGRTVLAGERISLIWPPPTGTRSSSVIPTSSGWIANLRRICCMAPACMTVPALPWPGSSYVFSWKNSSSAPISSTWCPGTNRSGRPTRRVDSTRCRCGFGDPRP